MTYDPAWDMPRINWQQQGSFQQAIALPEDGPGDNPVVCLPPINQYWLPIVLGCLDQLCNPSTWIAADDASLNNALEQAELLKHMLGLRVECVSYKVRFDPGTCQLQESTDGGSTWSEVDGWSDFNTCLPPQTRLSYDSGCTLNESFDGGSTFEAVPGWIDNFPACVQKYTPIIGLPPNPGDQSPDQLACSIATYLAEQVIVAAMGKAVTAISDDLTLLQFGLDVVNVIPEFVLVTLAADAFSAIYVAVQEGTLSDFEDALTDSTLLAAIKCAIYGCIIGQGYVRPSNFSCIVSSIDDISYSHADVIAAIIAYLNALGATGLAQLSQVAGLEQGADCSACSGWCHRFDFTESDGGWVAEASEDGMPAAVYVPTVGWTQYLPPTGGAQCRIARTLDADGDIEVYSIEFDCSDAATGGRIIQTYLAGTPTFTGSLGASAGPQYVGTAPNEVADTLVANINNNLNGSTIVITAIQIQGSGTDPITAGYPC